MTTLRFIPIFEEEPYLTACSEYETIWNTDAKLIIDAFKAITGLELQEEKIAALIYEGVSFSGRNKNDAMKLRASYTHDVKKGTLIHELGHRLTFHIHHDSSEAEHKFLNLFLYDVWERVYGKEFAELMVEVESKRNEMYARAWHYACALSFDDRQSELHNKLSKELK